MITSSDYLIILEIITMIILNVFVPLGKWNATYRLELRRCHVAGLNGRVWSHSYESGWMLLSAHKRNISDYQYALLWFISNTQIERI